MYDIKQIKNAVTLDYVEPKFVLNPNQDLYSGFQQMSFKKVKDGLQSVDFKTGSAGWKMKNTGDVEFNAGIFRGALEANSINIPDSVTASSFHTDNAGNSWWGAKTLATAPAKVLNTGAGTFTNLTATGFFTITGGTGVASLADAGALATLNTVGTAQIDALAVNDTKIASNAITVAKIASNAVTTAKIALGAVGSNELSAGAVIAGKITAGTIVSGDIATGTITAANIATGTITATQIAAGTITATNMNVSQLSAISADIGNINAGTITGLKVHAIGNGLASPSIDFYASSSDYSSAIITGWIYGWEISTSRYLTVYGKDGIVIQSQGGSTALNDNLTLGSDTTKTVSVLGKFKLPVGTNLY